MYMYRYLITQLCLPDLHKPETVEKTMRIENCRAAQACVCISTQPSRACNAEGKHAEAIRKLCGIHAETISKPGQGTPSQVGPGQAKPAHPNERWPCQACICM